MSKFYTFDELREEIPTVEAVSHARDAVLNFIESLEIHRDNVVLYGSAIWGLHKNIEDQHSRRSDVDVAIVEDISTTKSKLKMSFPHPELIKKVKTFCSDLEAVTNVPIEVNVFELNSVYECFISPSTADHFRLLANRFRKMQYGEFLGMMERQNIERSRDLENYIAAICGNNFNFLWGQKGELDLRDPKILHSLSKIENFPDHITRKLLGREKLLPCPDSRQNVREVFAKCPPKWPMKEKLHPLFEQMFSSSLEYEALIDEVSRGMPESEYYPRFGQIAQNMIAVAKGIFNRLECTVRTDRSPSVWMPSISSIVDIVRIPSGTPIIILSHYGNGKGSVTVERLDSAFGSPRNSDAEWIKDPKDSIKGWFTYKPKYWDYFCSVKPCDEELLKRFKEDTNEDSATKVVRSKSFRSYYKKFAKEALDPKYNNLPAYAKK